MAIIKNGRINIWDAVKKQFDVVHPETEVERITDFADGIVQKLALTSAMTAVTALQTDSWFGKLLKMALTASGVKYSIAENGYVCLGSLFGGLIIQWGNNTANTDGQSIAFPITIKKCFAITALDVDYGCDRMGATVASKSAFSVWTRGNNSNFVKTGFQWIAICD